MCQVLGVDVYLSVLLSPSSLSTPSLFLVDQSRVLRRVLSDGTELNSYCKHVYIHHGSISHLSGLDQLRRKRKIREKRKIGKARKKNPFECLCGLWFCLFILKDYHS